MMIVVIVLAVVFDFLNGFHDSSNIVATVISSRALRPRAALSITALAHFVAPFLFGVAVATMIGEGLIDPNAISTTVVVAALVASIAWNLFTWLIGMPSSSSHALVGGLLGAAIIAEGVSVVHWDGLAKILLALLLSPILGFVIAWVIMQLFFLIFPGASHRINDFFKRGQVITSISLALSHGTNDAQKTMGLITMGLVAAGIQSSFEVPTWVIFLSAITIALGTAFGGWRLIYTLGGRIYTIRPVHAFTSQLASTAVILGAALLGGPVSTTQVVGSSVIGAGAAERVKKVRWQVGRDMLVTWLVTIPVTFALSALVYLIITYVLGLLT